MDFSVRSRIRVMIGNIGGVGLVVESISIFRVHHMRIVDFRYIVLKRHK